MFLNLVAPINQLGYGVAGCNVLRALVEAGHTVSYFPLGQPQWDKDLPVVRKCIENAKMFSPEAPSMRMWHQHDLAMFPGKGERIGWPIFELDRFNMLEQHHLTSVDRLFVCSEWARSIIEKERINDGGKRVDVIPLGVDNDTFYVDEEARRQRAYWTRDKTVFINCGKWEVRKGHKELLEAFCEAFGPDDNVELWMLNHNPFIGKENEVWKTRYISSKMGGSIKLLSRVQSQDELRRIFNTVDFGVFPSHAEGWNLEVLELMACGVPSIVTNYSGHTEFCTKENSLLIEPNGMTKANDGKWFHGQGEWCTFKVDDLVEQLCHAHELKQSQKEGYGQLVSGCRYTANQFTWANTAKKIEDVL